jgi:wyosine [tRNA(Phe)-imidazoG37] synthetase (radical SAM superfamily)
MPSHASIREFSDALAARTGYRVASEREDSRVCLLTRDGELHHIARAQLGEKFVANA